MSVAPALRVGRQRLFVHEAPQAQRPHVSPGFFDIFETGFLVTRYLRVAPAAGYGFPFRPDGILFFVIDEDAEDTVFAIKATCHNGFPIG